MYIFHICSENRDKFFEIDRHKSAKIIKIDATGFCIEEIK